MPLAPWLDAYKRPVKNDEEAPEQPHVDLPDENEKEGEDGGQDYEAAGALSENNEPEGVKDVPPGEDEISGTKSEEYDDVLSVFNEGDDNKEDDDDKGEDDDDDEGGSDDDDDDDDSGSDDEGGSDDDESKNCGGGCKGKKGKGKDKGKKGASRKNQFGLSFRNEEQEPEQPHVDLPDENEKEGEDGGQDYEAAGALSEDGNPEGIDNVPAGEDEISGTKSEEYDDVLEFARNEGDDDKGDDDDDDDDDGEGGDDDDDEGSDDDNASEKEPTKGPDENCGGGCKGKKGKGKGGKGKGKYRNEGDSGDDDNKGDDDDDDNGEGGSDDDDDGGKKDDDEVTDFLTLVNSEDIEEPETPGNTESVEPVDGEGKKVDPIGNPDLPDNLTEPVLLPVETPPDEQNQPIGDSWMFF